jgi:hypothetical protein
MKPFLFAIPLIFVVLPAFAADILACPVPPGTQSTSELGDLPAPIAVSLKQHVPYLDPVTAPFNGGDTMGPGQTHLDRRFIRAFHKGSRWIVAYEAAGIGYHDNIVVYDVAGDQAELLANNQASTASVCSDMTKWLDQTPTGAIGRFW